MTDSGEIALIDKDTGVQWPLATSPWSPGMSHAAIPVKYAVPVNHLHLGDSFAHPQIFLGNLGQRQAQEFYQALDIVFIKGDCRFTMTAITASFAFEYIFQFTAPLVDKYLQRPIKGRLFTGVRG